MRRMQIGQELIRLSSHARVFLRCSSRVGIVITPITYQNRHNSAISNGVWKPIKRGPFEIPDIKTRIILITFWSPNAGNDSYPVIAPVDSTQPAPSRAAPCRGSMGLLEGFPVASTEIGGDLFPFLSFLSFPLLTRTKEEVANSLR
jgi:hypothetical protein